MNMFKDVRAPFRLITNSTRSHAGTPRNIVCDHIGLVSIVRLLHPVCPSCDAAGEKPCALCAHLIQLCL
jgi:hypothetical protein